MHGLVLVELAIFSLALAVTFTNIRCTCPRRDGQTELAEWLTP